MVTLETLQTLAARHRETDPELARRLQPSWLAFPVLEGTLQAAGGEKTSVVLPSAGACVLQP